MASYLYRILERKKNSSEDWKPETFLTDGKPFSDYYKALDLKTRLSKSNTFEYKVQKVGF